MGRIRLARLGELRRGKPFRSHERRDERVGASRSRTLEVGYASAREIAGFYQVKRGGALQFVHGDMVEVTPAGEE